MSRNRFRQKTERNGNFRKLEKPDNKNINMEIIVDTQLRIGENGAYTAFIDLNGNEIILREINHGYRTYLYNLNHRNPVMNAQCRYVGTCNLERVNEDGTVGIELRNILQNTLNDNWYLVTNDELESMFTETGMRAF